MSDNRPGGYWQCATAPAQDANPYSIAARAQAGCRPAAGCQLSHGEL